MFMRFQIYISGNLNYTTEIKTVKIFILLFCFRPHAFDMTNRKKAEPKRKSGKIPDYRMPSKGTQPVRQFHKADSSKVLPHVRHGLVFD